MTKLSVIEATFSDFRLIKGRKCAQLIFEIPLERADESLATLGGLPRIDAERWFAIARLDPSKIKVQLSTSDEKERRSFASLPLPQQIGMRCTDQEFVRFCESRPDFALGTRGINDHVVYVRWRCRVTSRADIQHGTEAAKLWKQLDDEFWFWRRGDVA